MRVGIRIPPCRPLPEVEDLAKQAEEAGFDTIAMPDSPAGLRDVMLSIGAAARATEQMTLATSVTNVVTRQPVVIASESRTIAELAPGRFRLGLGAGFTAVRLTGQRPATTDRLRSGVLDISALLSGEAISTENGEVRLLDPGGPLPIYLAAHGPRNLALAVELADGVITTTRQLTKKLNALSEAITATKRQRRLAIALNVVGGLTNDLQADAQLLKPRILRYCQGEGRREFEEAGFEVSVPAEIVVLPDGKQLGKSRDLASAVEISSKWISDPMAIWYAQNICLYGSGEQIATSLGHYASRGVDEVIFGQASSYTLPIDLVEQIGAEVIPRMHEVNKNISSSR